MASLIDAARQLWKAIGNKNTDQSITPKMVDEAAQKTLDAVEFATPYIGENGNWWVGGIDTNKPSAGVSVIAGEVDINGDLIITFSDGKTYNAGHVQGKDGKNGIDGISPTIAIHSTVTGWAGTAAKVENMGTANDIKLKFTIPTGAKGEPGAKGEGSPSYTARNPYEFFEALWNAMGEQTREFLDSWHLRDDNIDDKQEFIDNSEFTKHAWIYYNATVRARADITQYEEITAESDLNKFINQNYGVDDMSGHNVISITHVIMSPPYFRADDSAGSLVFDLIMEIPERGEENLTQEPSTYKIRFNYLPSNRDPNSFQLHSIHKHVW